MAEAASQRDFSQVNTTFLKRFLNDRGVSVSKQRKQDLVLLCQRADSIGIELDPDGLLESRSEIVAEKLRVGVKSLTLPTLLESSNDLSKVPTLNPFDILHYLSKGHDLSVVRNHKDMEGFHLHKDGYVLDLSCACLSSPHVAMLAKVKPRTNAKDPQTGLPYYICWIILSTCDTEERILSAYCCCRGGIDGFCRHVTAALFEYMSFRGEESVSTTSPSCTSMPCVWNRPKNVTEPTEPVAIRDLNTSVSERSTSPSSSNQDSSSLLSKKPDSSVFFSTIKDLLPDACLLDVRYERQKSIGVTNLNVLTPSQKMLDFRIKHQCENADCKCSYIFLQQLSYTQSEHKYIEQATLGQASNPNWYAMRNQILTASRFKTVCHSTNQDNTASTFLKENTLDSTHLPAPIQYGKKNENRARNLFFRSHQIKHKKCKLEEKGLCFSKETPYLACSPDGIIDCSECGEFLIEVKCLWKYRNFHPKIAALMSGIIKDTEKKSYTIVEKNAYNYQIQGQMGVTGIKQAILVIYTDKGIYSLNVPFDMMFWKEMSAKLELFYHQHFFPKICS